MTREKIISLASDAGFDIDEANEYHAEDQVKDSGNNWITHRLESFYRAVLEEAAKACESDDLDFPRQCATAIREMVKEMK